MRTLLGIMLAFSLTGFAVGQEPKEILMEGIEFKDAPTFEVNAAKGEYYLGTVNAGYLGYKPEHRGLHGRLGFFKFDASGMIKTAVLEKSDKELTFQFQSKIRVPNDRSEHFSNFQADEDFVWVPRKVLWEAKLLYFATDIFPVDQPTSDAKPVLLKNVHSEGMVLGAIRGQVIHPQVFISKDLEMIQKLPMNQWSPMKRFGDPKDPKQWKTITLP